MSKDNKPYFEKNYFFNDISTIEHWYPILKLIAKEKGDMISIKRHTIDQPFYNYKKMEKIKKVMLKDQENDGNSKDLNDYKLKYLQEIITDIRNWTSLIYFNDKIQKFEIQRKYSENFALPLSENKLKFFLFTHLRDHIGGDLILKRRNSSFFLFLSFLIEKNMIKITEEKSGSEPYIKLIDDFRKYLNLYNFYYYTQRGNALEWNYGKIKNILKVYEDLSLISHFKDDYFIFGDLDYYDYFLKKLLRITLNLANEEENQDNSLMLPVKKFLKIINDKLIYLPMLNTTESELPLFIEGILKDLEKNKLIELSDLGDKQEFCFENGDSIKLIYIDIKKVMNIYV